MVNRTVINLPERGHKKKFDDCRVPEQSPETLVKRQLQGQSASQLRQYQSMFEPKWTLWTTKEEITVKKKKKILEFDILLCHKAFGRMSFTWDWTGAFWQHTCSSMQKWKQHFSVIKNGSGWLWSGADLLLLAQGFCAVKSKDYQDILEPNVLSRVKKFDLCCRSWVFRLEKHKKKHSRMTGWTILKSSSMSSDLNPAEHPWKYWRHAVWRRHLLNLTQWEQFVLKEKDKPCKGAKVLLTVTGTVSLQQLFQRLVHKSMIIFVHQNLKCCICSCLFSNKYLSIKLIKKCSDFKL